MSNEDIAEYLAIAYALHCANCHSNDTEEIKYSEFVECYKNYIPDFRREVGASEPFTG